jgi:hypothetical protein
VKVKRQVPLLLALALFAGPVRAETVEASSTTFLNLGAQTRFRGGSTPEVVTVAPLYEILSVSARDINTGFTDDFRLVLSTWGSWDLAHRRWDAGVPGKLTGDVTTGYVQAKFAHQAITLRVGRTMIATGVARMIQIDGGQLLVAVPVSVLTLSASGYAGVPTSQRFQGRTGLVSWNPVAGTLAYGGRVAVGYPIAGVPGRGLEIGASANMVQEHSDPVRQEVGGDLRLQPFSSTDLALAGFGSYSLYDRRWAEASAALSMSPTARFHVTADWRFVEPSLLLARNSILSVFTASTWTEYGVGGRYDLGRGLHAGLDLHLRSEPGKDYGSKYLGSDVAGRMDWERSDTAAGIELSNLNSFENGYFGVRLYGRRDLGKIVLTGDVLGQYFRADVNGQKAALTGTVTAGYKLPHDFTALIAGSAGMTPYLEQTFNLMVKLAYNQTYRTEEVH